MAGRYTKEYWFKTEKRDELLKGQMIFEVAEKIGLEKHFLTSLITGNKCCKRKVTVYAVTKYINPNYEIEDVFKIKELG